MGAREKRQYSPCISLLVFPCLYFPGRVCISPFMSQRIKIHSPFFTFAAIQRRLNITLLAITKWRQGSPRRLPLPVHVELKGKVKRYHVRESDLVLWLTAYRPDLLSLWQSTR